MAKRDALKRNLSSLFIALGVAAVFVGAYTIEQIAKFEILGILEAKTVDARFRLRGERPPSGDVVIAAIDSKSIEKLGRWPWTRSVHARLIDRLREWGASALAFDVLFTEEEGASEARRLERIANALPADGGEELAAAKAAVDDALGEVLADRKLAKAMEKTFDADAALTVFAFDFVFEDDIAHTGQLGKVLSDDDTQLFIDIATYATRDANVPYLRQEPPKLAIGIRPVITSLAGGCAALGYANPVFDPDGVLRREQVLTVFSPGVRDAYLARQPVAKALLDDKTWVQAFLPLSIAGVATHLRLTPDQLVLDMEKGEVRFPVRTKDGKTIERAHHFDRFDGTARVDFYGPSNTIPTYSIVDIIEGKAEDPKTGKAIDGATAFGGKLVFIGMSDPGLADFFPTPFTARLPGVEKHAMFADNMIHGREVRSHSDADLVVLLSALGAALLVAIAAGNFGAVGASVVLLVGSGGWFWFTFEDFSRNGLVWPWTIPGLTLVFGFAGVTAYRQFSEEKDKRFIRGVFSHYMSPAAVEKVLSNPEALKLGGERRACSIFFSDLVGFTTLSESMKDPADLVKLMNRYLGRMTGIILEEDGILDKYIGDAIMAIFGAPIERADHAARACNAALRNMEALQGLRAEFRAEGLPDIDCRIGINTGEVVIGNMGSEVRMDYTCLGDAVNLASRLEGANKPFGSHIMVGERTQEEASALDPDLCFRRLDILAVKGKIEGVEVFELYGKVSKLTDVQKRAAEQYEKAMEFYRGKKFEPALEAFRAVLAIDPDDGPAKTYVARCEHFVEEPPPADWDGVYRLKEK